MLENVTIVDKNGNGIIANGVMYIRFKDTNKKYVCYSLNEMATEDQVKVYVAETADTVGIAGSINDEEWKEIKKLMVSLTHKEDTPNIEFMKMSGGSFYIGDVRKLQIKIPVKQALADAQTANVIASSQMPGGISSEEKPVFFDKSAVEEPVVIESSSEPTINAFSMTAEQPEESAPLTNVVEEPAPLTNVTSQVVEEPMIPVVETVQTIDTRSQNAITEPVLQPEPVLEPPKENVVKDENKVSSDVLITNEQAIESINYITSVMPKIQENVGLLNEYIKQHGIEKSSNDVQVINTIKEQSIIEQPVIEESVITTVEEPVIQSAPLNMETNTIIDLQPPQIVVSTEEPVKEELVSVVETPVVQPQNEVINNIVENNTQPSGIVDPIMTVQTPVVEQITSEPSFEIPVIPEPQVTQEILQPISTPPVDTGIPDVTPVVEQPVADEYVHVAQGNNSAAIINYSDIPQQEMPAVEMPLGYQNIDEAKSKMMEQVSLGPSGLSEDSQKTLGLVA